jgi:hypothetical protein
VHSSYSSCQPCSSRVIVLAEKPAADQVQEETKIPRVDLPALRPFFLAMLWLNKRRYRGEANGLGFRTPDAWLDEPGVRTSYTDLRFSREQRHAASILGVGHLAMDKALRQATNLTGCVACINQRDLARPLCIYRITNRVTDTGNTVRSVIAGVEGDRKAAELRTLRDEELVSRLNALLTATGMRRPTSSPRAEEPEAALSMVEAEKRLPQATLGDLDLTFRVPEIQPLALLS